MSSSSSSSSSSEDEQSINMNEDATELIEGEEEAPGSTSQEEDSRAPGEAPPQATMVAPTLSKSWSVASAHVPIFTGGKVVPCHVQSDKGHRNEKESNESGASNISIPCLLLPVNGDIAVVDAQRGIKLGSVRAGTSGSLYNHNDDDDDDDGLDGDAITAYALSANQKILMTCTQNHLVRQYSCHVTTTSTEKNAKKSDNDAPDEATQSTANANATEKSVISVQLQKTWGKSGHSLPVTNMEFHSSGVFVASASVDGSVRIWDVRGGHVTHIFRPLAGGSGGGSGRLSVTAIRWLDDIAHLVIAIGRDDGSIAIHDLRDQDMKHVVVLRDHLSAVTCMDWWWKGNTNLNDTQELQQGGSSNIIYPSMFVTTSRDAVLNFWSIDQSSAKRTKSKKAKNTKSKHSNADFNRKAASAPLYRREQTVPLYEQVEGMVLLPDHEDDSALTIVTAGSKGIVRLWKTYQADDGDISEPILSTKQPTSQAYGESRGGYLGLFCVKAADFRSGKHISSSSPYNQLLVADAEHCLSFLSLDSSAEEALETKRTIVGFNDEILDLRVIPSMEKAAEPSSIVVATNSAQVRIFDLDNFSCHVLDGHTATVLCVDVSPCGRYIATSGKDKQMCIWHTQTRKCVATAVGHTEAIGAAALSRKAGKFF